MGILVTGQVGIQTLGDGVTQAPLRQGRTAELMVSELHGRFYEQTFRGNLYSAGMKALTSISAVTFTTGTLGATCTPIAGVWNPLGSGKNLSILQATLGAIITALQATGGGPYAWAAAIGQSALTLGAAPLNRATLQASGSVAKDMSGVALTGLSGTLAVICASALAGGIAYNIASLATAASFHTQEANSVENLDGALIVPPGGVLALLATTTPVAHSALSALLWDEVPT